MEESSGRKLEFMVVGDDPVPEAGQPAESDSGEPESQLVYLAQAECRALGTTLQEARKQRGITLREAADALRIRYVYLEAIETGRFNNLPGGVYVSGFLITTTHFGW